MTEPSDGVEDTGTAVGASAVSDFLDAAARESASGSGPDTPSDAGAGTDDSSAREHATLTGDADADDDAPKIPWRRRHPRLAIAAIVAVVIAIPLGATYGRALTKPGSESFMARSAGWARDMKLGFLLDRVEQEYYARNQPVDGGTPAVQITTPPTTAAPPQTAVVIPHLAAPIPMPSPAAEPIPNEGVWIPAGPTTGGLPGVYVTKVRPNAKKSSLLVYAVWMDPKLVELQLFPGTDLPGGQWGTPSQIPADRCAQAIVAMNSGFRMDQARGGYYAEGREAFPLVDGAASMVFYPDGTADVGQWGRDFTRDDLPKMAAVRQNLELLVDDGKPVADVDSDKDWGALLKNIYFVWRSGYGVTKDGAIVFVGGPALTPRDLAERLIDAGAVRAMEGDINPEWVTANLYSAGPDGVCHGTKGLDGSEEAGGQRQPADRYLSSDTRDFVVAFTRPG